MGYSFRLAARVAHTTAFVTPIVQHWLQREIAQWVHHEGSIHNPTSANKTVKSSITTSKDMNTAEIIITESRVCEYVRACVRARVCDVGRLSKKKKKNLIYQNDTSKL